MGGHGSWTLARRTYTNTAQRQSLAQTIKFPKFRYCKNDLILYLKKFFFWGHWGNAELTFMRRLYKGFILYRIRVMQRTDARARTTEDVRCHLPKLQLDLEFATLKKRHLFPPASSSESEREGEGGRRPKTMRNFKQWSINDGAERRDAIDKINAIGDAHRTDWLVTDYPDHHTSAPYSRFEAQIWTPTPVFTRAKTTLSI